MQHLDEEPGDGALVSSPKSAPRWRDRAVGWLPAPGRRRLRPVVVRSDETSVLRSSRRRQGQPAWPRGHRSRHHDHRTDNWPRTRKIQLFHRVQHEPSQMTLGQPVGHRRRHQQQLVTVCFSHVDSQTSSSRAARNAGGMVGIRATAWFGYYRMTGVSGGSESTAPLRGTSRLVSLGAAAQRDLQLCVHGVACRADVRGGRAPIPTQRTTVEVP